MIFRFISYPLLLVLTTLCLFSCVHDRAQDCLHSLEFEYIHHNYGGDRFAREVHSVSLYVYDESGDYVRSFQSDVSDLKTGNRMSLQLPSGKYSIVIWGNYDPSTYLCEAGKDLSEHRLTLLHDPLSGVVNSIESPLFYGYVEITVKPKGLDRVSMLKDKNQIDVILEYAHSDDTRTHSESDYSVSLIGCNGVYNYDNSMAGSDQLQYIASYTEESSRLDAEFSILRLSPTSDMRVLIKDKRDGKVCINQLIAKEIMNAIGSDISTQSDFDRYDKHTLTYRITKLDDDTYVVALIKINDWDVINSGGGI